MDSKLQLFAKVLLKEHYDEFLEMIQLFNIDKRTFVLQHRKMFEKGWYDTSSEDNEFSEVDIMLCFAIVSHIDKKHQEVYLLIHLQANNLLDICHNLV